MERVGPAFLLQEKSPSKLLAVLGCLHSGAEEGWILMTVGDSSSEWAVEISARRRRLDMGVDVAIQFAGLLQVIAFESRCLFPAVADEVLPPRNVEIEVSQRRVRCSWDSNEAVKDAQVEGVLELRIHPAVALDMGVSILREIGSLQARCAGP